MKKSLLLTLSTLALCSNVFADCREAYSALKTQNKEDLQVSGGVIAGASTTLGVIAIFAPNPSLVAPMISLTLAGVAGPTMLTRSGVSWSSIELSNMMAIPEIVNEAEIGYGPMLEAMLDKMLQVKIVPVKTTLLELADKIVEMNDQNACMREILTGEEVFWNYKALGNNKRLDSYSEFFYKIARELSKSK